MLKSNPPDDTLSASDLLITPSSAKRGVSRCSTRSSSILGELHAMAHQLPLSICLFGGNAPRAHCSTSCVTAYHQVSPHSSTYHCMPQPALVQQWIPPAIAISSYTIHVSILRRRTYHFPHVLNAMGSTPTPQHSLTY